MNKTALYSQDSRFCHGFTVPKSFRGFRETAPRARTRTARFGDERTNHEATAPPTLKQKQIAKRDFRNDETKSYDSKTIGPVWSKIGMHCVSEMFPQNTTAVKEVYLWSGSNLGKIFQTARVQCTQCLAIIVSVFQHCWDRTRYM